MEQFLHLHGVGAHGVDEHLWTCFTADGVHSTAADSYHFTPFHHKLLQQRQSPGPHPRTQQQQHCRHAAHEEEGAPLGDGQGHVDQQHGQDAGADDELVQGTQRATQPGGGDLA